MVKLIRPDIFISNVVAFFTDRELGADIKRISSMLSIKSEDIFLPIQRHTSRILVLESSMDSHVADAVITKKKGIFIGIQVADCVPILLHDSKHSVIGAVHAGWRGTASQVIKKTIKTMNKYFHSLPKDIKIALGPSIRRNCYVVDKTVKDMIIKATGKGRYYRRHANGKHWIDLSSANIHQALSIGVLKENIWVSDECTYCNHEKYYSYRYGKDSRGRQGGFIGIL